MERTISATEARVHFGHWLRHVRERGEAVVVERAGKPEAVLVSAEEYQRLRSSHDGRAERDPLVRAAELRAAILERRGGELLPAPEEVIAAGREERDRDIAPVR